MNEAILVLSLIATFGTLLLYAIIGVRRSTRAVSVEEHLWSAKKLTEEQYATTMVAYALQLVVTVYFIYWGFRFGIGVFWYLLFWWVGIRLFQAAAPRLIAFAQKTETLHGFLQQTFGAGWIVRRLTAACTFLGLLGALLIEADFATTTFSDFLSTLRGSPTPTAAWIILFFTLIGFVLWYVVAGGFKASVITDEAQLAIALVGLSSVVAYLAVLGSSSGFAPQGRLLLLLLYLYLAGFYLSRQSLSAARLRSPELREDRDWVATAIPGAALIGALAFALTFLIPGKPPATELAGAVPLYSIDALWSQMRSWRDWLVLASFLALDLSWQFVDMSAWQRLQALNLESLDEAAAVARVKRAIASTKWESPLSWGFGILLGMGLHYSGLFQSVDQAETSLGALVRALGQPAFGHPLLDLLAVAILPALLVAFLSVMVSTVDSCMAAITFTAYSDLAGPHFGSAASPKTRLSRAQRTTFVVVVGGAATFLLFKLALNLSPFLVINLAYASQLSLLPTVLLALWRSGPSALRSSTAAASSVIGGLVGTYAVGIGIASNQSLQDLAYTIPNVTAICGALAGLAVGWFIEVVRRRVTSQQAA